MGEIEMKFVDQNADSNDLALRGFGQGADRVSSVKDFVDQVLAKLDPKKDCIKKLDLIGHGSPGNIDVGSGKTVARTGGQSLDLNNIAQWEPQLRRLRCKFCKPDGEFNLIGCNTGAGLAGARLLRLIVNFIRCRKATATPEPVEPLEKSYIKQIVEAIGEGAEEHARLPTPIEPEHLKTVSMRPALGPKTLIARVGVASLRFYDPAAIVGARVLGSSSGRRTAAKTLAPPAVAAIRASLKGAEVVLAPIALYAVEGQLQLKVKVSARRSIWLRRGAIVGGYSLYSPFGEDTTFLYALKPRAQRHLVRLAKIAR